MAKTPAKTNDTVHPDVALIAAYQDAQQTIKAYQDRMQTVVDAMVRQMSQPAPDALDAAKARINAWLEKEYPNKSARRGVAMDIDLDGYKYDNTVDMGDVAPEFLNLASEVFSGKILKDGTEALFADIVEYVCSARDEDGAPVLLEYQQSAVKHIFFPPAAPVRATRVKKEKVDGAVSASNGTTAVGKKYLKWPGTDIGAQVSEFANGAIRVQGRAKKNLVEALAKVGITVTNEAVDKTLAEVYRAS